MAAILTLKLNDGIQVSIIAYDLGMANYMAGSDPFQQKIVSGINKSYAIGHTLLGRMKVSFSRHLEPCTGDRDRREGFTYLEDHNDDVRTVTRVLLLCAAQP